MARCADLGHSAAARAARVGGRRDSGGALPEASIRLTVSAASRPEASACRPTQSDGRRHRRAASGVRHGDLRNRADRSRGIGPEERARDHGGAEDAGVHRRGPADRGAPAGADEVLFLDTAGHCSEASASNLFAVIGGTLATPPTSCAALPGITRAAVIELAAELGVPVDERPFGLDELRFATRRSSPARCAASRRSCG